MLLMRFEISATQFKIQSPLSFLVQLWSIIYKKISRIWMFIMLTKKRVIIYKQALMSLLSKL
ncbi:MAG TPA: hypothetical protein DEE98_00305 [Elusimicrobia bacterium]|nr:MAG: hypothetical protein A2278_08620 [Elusimicrobia bacterium RIFOXYA12_FULL_49_49]OGS09633.1 MAG: hypothetical protein A2204_04045 [Elusimicrobia bacterium RIFOXYA1_FULL_47_7]OGS10751.1 MAG: hypothetical protein A2386_01785 [Elusimicrobia bacterium RIFOXYB1_FULL_48_9]OGS14808.1 MAG: hypothetical protein A2251_09975 [Elusimicrobia bacterium RIFOXYA2_FULL_47_53]OGS25542.1 MAG: hypothetical protein A2339_05620 [Elusimicrobia bacterium RIFOXYB12_FULL_50_12]OGS28908.1 MAG: hypothetical protein